MFEVSGEDDSLPSETDPGDEHEETVELEEEVGAGAHPGHAGQSQRVSREGTVLNKHQFKKFTLLSYC